MKKVIALIACAAVMVMGLALAGCGSNTEKGVADCVWYTVKVPEGYKVDSDTGTCSTAKWVDEATGAMIKPVWDKSSTADEAIESDLRIFADSGWAKGEDVTFGDITWKTVDFIWNGNPSVTYYADIQGIEVEINAFELARGDASVEQFLSSMVFAENLDEAITQARDKDISSVKF